MTDGRPPLDRRGLDHRGSARSSAAVDAERRRLWAQASAESGPWHAASGVMSGVLLFGVLGWLVGRWVGSPWPIAAGVLLGTAVAMTSLWFRYGVDRSSSR